MSRVLGFLRTLCVDEKRDRGATFWGFGGTLCTQPGTILCVREDDAGC